LVSAVGLDQRLILDQGVYLFLVFWRLSCYWPAQPLRYRASKVSEKTDPMREPF
jgi:hypothetical protein